MPNNQSNTLHDGFRSLEQGIDAGYPAHLLPVNQAAYSINTTFRGGSPKNRPGYNKRVLTFGAQTLPDGSLTGAAKKTAFETGLFQGGGYLQTPNGLAFLVASINGRIYSINLNDYHVSDITPYNGAVADPNSSRERKTWMQQAEDFLIIQNNLNAAIIWNGASVRRANSLDYEVPTGGPMAYYMGRLWVAKDRNYWASDLVGSSSGTAAYNRKDAVLKFSENTYLAGGGSFTVPMQNGAITAMHPIANLNTALGHTDMAVFSPGGICLVTVPTDRLQWQSMEIPLQRIVQPDNGSLCEVTSVNGDIWYRSQDGLRSLMMAVRNYGDWANVPASGEMTPIFAEDSEHMLKYASSALFDNRLIHTVAPFNTARGVAHKGVAVLDFDLVSRMRSKLPPAWEGIWTGLQILQLVPAIVNGVRRLFTFVCSSDNRIEVWEFSKNARTDNGDSIAWQFDPRRMDFKAPETFKRLESADIWVDDIQSSVTFLVKYRSDRNPEWQTWHTWSECANGCMASGECNTVENPTALNMPQPQYRANMQLPQPPDDCDTLTGKPFRTGYEFQPRIIITGHCLVSKLHLEAKVLPDETLPVSPCLGTGTCLDSTACEMDKFNVITSHDDGVTE